MYIYIYIYIYAKIVLKKEKRNHKIRWRDR